MIPQPRTTIIFAHSYRVWQACGQAGCRFETSADAIRWVHVLLERDMRILNLYIDSYYVNLPYLVVWRTL